MERRQLFQPVRINISDPPEHKLRLLMTQPQMRELLKEHFREVIMAGLKESLEKEKHRALVAERKANVLQEEVKLVSLAARARQLQQRPTMNRLLNDGEVIESYNRLQKK